MEELTNTKVDWKKIAVVGFLVILTGLVSAGATWYVLDMEKQAELDVKDNEITDLTTKIGQLQNGATEATTSDNDEATTASWNIYRNDAYKFQLTFPDSWKGYTVVKEKTASGTQASFTVYVPTEDEKWGSDKANMFLLGIYTRDQWATAQSTEGPKQSLVGTTGNYIVGYSHAQDAPIDVTKANLASSIKAIVESFKAL